MVDNYSVYDSINYEFNIQIKCESLSIIFFEMTDSSYN